jgi:hypothetical protein
VSLLRRDGQLTSLKGTVLTWHQVERIFCKTNIHQTKRIKVEFKGHTVSFIAPSFLIGFSWMLRNWFTAVRIVSGTTSQWVKIHPEPPEDSPAHKFAMIRRTGLAERNRPNQNPNGGSGQLETIQRTVLITPHAFTLFGGWVSHGNEFALFRAQFLNSGDLI